MTEYSPYYRMPFWHVQNEKQQKCAMSVCLPACPLVTNLKAPEIIFMKSDIRQFHQDWSIHSNSDYYNQTDTLHRDLHAFLHAS
jgi:hypothetical protein